MASSMHPPFDIVDLHASPARGPLLALNNASARETSLLTFERFNELIDAACVALFVAPAKGLLLAFENTDHYDGRHFLWFREKLPRFLYIDRIVIDEQCRRRGLARLLYSEVFRQARLLGLSQIACEVNIEPPNPTSDQFHAALGFREVGRATFDDGAKTVRYLVADL